MTKTSTAKTPILTKFCTVCVVALLIVLSIASLQAQNEDEIRERMQKVEKYLQAKTKAKAEAQKQALRLVADGNVKELQEFLGRPVIVA